MDHTQSLARSEKDGGGKQFAYDPIWLTHLPVLENLRRIHRIDVEACLDEQEAFWAVAATSCHVMKRRRRDRWLQLHRECGAKYKQVYGG